MAYNIPVSRICQKYDTEINWITVNPILLKGELAIVEFDGYTKMKIGDGVTHFNDLKYFVDPKEIERLNNKINDLRECIILLLIPIIICITQIAFLSS